MNRQPPAPGTEVAAGDADARRAIVEDLDETLVIEAAAGTGKTTELVNRVLRLLAKGRATMTEIVAGDVHGKSGGRAETAAPRSDRAGASVGCGS